MKSLKCIDKGSYKLTVGKIYMGEPIPIDNGNRIFDYYITNDVGYKHGVESSLFIEVDIIRDIKLDIIMNKYKAISAYKIPDDPQKWKKCPNCNLTPLIWEFDNGRSTACGCGESVYRNFSIISESIMSHVKRNNGSALHYDCDKLRKNWNHWVDTGEELEKYEDLIKDGKW